MKKLFSILIITVCNVVFGQTHRFIYELTTKRKSRNDKQYMVLDINKDKTRFYGYGFLEEIRMGVTPTIAQCPSCNHDQTLVHDRKTGENSIFFTEDVDYFTIKSKDKMD